MSEQPFDPAEVAAQPTVDVPPDTPPRFDRAAKKTVPPRPIRETIKPDSSRSKERKVFPQRDRESKPRKEVPYPKGGYRAELEGFYATIAMGVFPFDQVCGKAILDSAPECARTLDELAQKSPAVRRMIAAATTTSAVGAVLMAHAPILIAVMSHHTSILKFPGMIDVKDVEAEQNTAQVFNFMDSVKSKVDNSDNAS